MTVTIHGWGGGGEGKGGPLYMSRARDVLLYQEAEHPPELRRCLELNMITEFNSRVSLRLYGMNKLIADR